MIVLISYDLNGKRPESYEAVKKMITTPATSYKKPLYSQWFVETKEGPDDWHKRMKEVTDTAITGKSRASRRVTKGGSRRRPGNGSRLTGKRIGSSRKSVVLSLA